LGVDIVLLLVVPLYHAFVSSHGTLVKNLHTVAGQVARIVRAQAEAHFYFPADEAIPLLLSWPMGGFIPDCDDNSSLAVDVIHPTTVFSELDQVTDLH
jgi:hypothetical protein